MWQRRARQLLVGAPSRRVRAVRPVTVHSVGCVGVVVVGGGSVQMIVDVLGLAMVGIIVRARSLSMLTIMSLRWWWRWRLAVSILLLDRGFAVDGGGGARRWWPRLARVALGGRHGRRWRSFTRLVIQIVGCRNFDTVRIFFPLVVTTSAFIALRGSIRLDCIDLLGKLLLISWWQPWWLLPTTHIVRLEVIVDASIEIVVVIVIVEWMSRTVATVAFARLGLRVATENATGTGERMMMQMMISGGRIRRLSATAARVLTTAARAHRLQSMVRPRPTEVLLGALLRCEVIIGHTDTIVDGTVQLILLLLQVIVVVIVSMFVLLMLLLLLLLLAEDVYKLRHTFVGQSLLGATVSLRLGVVVVVAIADGLVDHRVETRFEQIERHDVDEHDIDGKVEYGRALRLRHRVAHEADGDDALTLQPTTIGVGGLELLGHGRLEFGHVEDDGGLAHRQPPAALDHLGGDARVGKVGPIGLDKHLRLAVSFHDHISIVGHADATTLRNEEEEEEEEEGKKKE